MPNVRYVDCSSIDVIHSLKASMNGIGLLIQNKDIALISKDSSYLISISKLIKFKYKKHRKKWPDEVLLVCKLERLHQVDCSEWRPCN